MQARRDEIALIACRVVAAHGFDQASMVRIAREAGYTTGMLAHYFDSKQDIIIAALRLILRRIDERLTQPAAATARPDLLALLTEALPVDEQRRTECAFWTAFWGQVSTDRRLRRINGWVHARVPAVLRALPGAGLGRMAAMARATREQVLRSLVTFINGLTAGAVANAGDWPPAAPDRAAAAAARAAARLGARLVQEPRRRSAPPVPEARRCTCRGCPGRLESPVAPVLDSNNEEPRPMLRQLTRLCVRYAERYIPNPYLYAVILTFITVARALLWTASTPGQVLEAWYRGIWEILAFAMQMALVLVTGVTLADAPAVKGLLRRLAGVPAGQTGAAITVFLSAALASWLNWGFGLVVGALVAREIAKRLTGRGLQLPGCGRLHGIHGVGVGPVEFHRARHGHPRQRAQHRREGDRPGRRLRCRRCSPPTISCPCCCS